MKKIDKKMFALLTLFAMPLFGEKITITPRVSYLTTDGSNIPETYRPKMGGIRTADNSLEFAGMPADKIRGNSIFIGSLKAQYNLSKLVYLDTTYSRANISQKAYSFGTEEKESYKFGLGVKAAPMVGRAVSTRPGNVFTVAWLIYDY